MNCTIEGFSTKSAAEKALQRRVEKFKRDGDSNNAWARLHVYPCRKCQRFHIWYQRKPKPSENGGRNQANTSPSRSMSEIAWFQQLTAPQRVSR